MEQWFQYVVRPSDRWTSIAEKFNVDEEVLRGANPTPHGSLIVGQPVRIPCILAVPPSTSFSTPESVATLLSPMPSGPARPTSCAAPLGWVPYTVQRGDTLSELASLCRTNVAAILQANGCRIGSVIYAGETLRLPCMPSRPTSTPIHGGAGGQSVIPSLITSPGGGSLDVRVSLTGHRLVVTIADAGSFEYLSVVLSAPTGIQSLSTTATQSGSSQVSFPIAAFLPGWYRVSISGGSGSQGEGAYYLRATETPTSPVPSTALTPSPQVTPSTGDQPTFVLSPTPSSQNDAASQQEHPSQDAHPIVPSPGPSATQPTAGATSAVGETPTAGSAPTPTPEQAHSTVPALTEAAPTAIATEETQTPPEQP